MQICNTKNELKSLIEIAKKKCKSIGFIPTMGALHQGHLSLVENAKKNNDFIVVSIFVNPIQFNNKEDLTKYPRTLENDCKLLENIGCNLVFAPSPEEMYPSNEEIETFNFGNLESVMEGKNRPGHFNGVGIVVSRLFKLVEPNYAYFGEKDFQQVSIICDLVKQMKADIKIVSCPIFRASDGLALSSRNALLNIEQRNIAPFIHKTLQESKLKSKNLNPLGLKQWVENEFANKNGIELEYFEISDAKSLQSISTWEDAQYSVGCIVCHIGKVRLIDNIRY